MGRHHIRSNSGASNSLLAAGLRREVTLVVSAPLLLEYEAVMIRPEGLAPGDGAGRTRSNRHSAHPEHGSGDVDEGQIVLGEPVVAGREAAEVFQPVEAALDAVSELVDQGVMRDWDLA